MNPTDEAKIDDSENWDEGTPVPPDTVVYPEHGPLPEARFSLNFAPDKAPLLTVRAHSPAELTAQLQELEDNGVYAAIGVAHASLKAQAAVGAGLGPTTPVAAPQGPPAPPQMPQGPGAPPPFGPNVSAPQAPGYQGPPAPPAPPQQNGGGWGGGAVQDRRPEYQQAGWYKVSFPFSPAKKAEFDGITAQYQMKKGRPSEGGQFSFNKEDKSWYVAREYAGAFQQFHPVPA